MKAITTRYLGFTNTKPSRIKASAEGVKPLTVTTASLDRNSVEDLHIQAAKLLCKRQDWPVALASGGTKKPDVWVHCFVDSAPLVNAEIVRSLLATVETLATQPTGEFDVATLNRDVAAAKAALAGLPTPAPVSVNDQLAGALEDLLEAYAPHARRNAKYAGIEVLHSAVAGAITALDQAKPFLHGQEHVAFQARQLLTTKGNPKADGTITVSAYHLTLLETALEGVGCELPLVQASKVLATTYPQTSSQALQVDAHAWECFKAELDKF